MYFAIRSAESRPRSLTLTPCPAAHARTSAVLGAPFEPRLAGRFVARLRAGAVAEVFRVVAFRALVLRAVVFRAAVFRAAVLRVREPAAFLAALGARPVVEVPLLRETPYAADRTASAPSSVSLSVSKDRRTRDSHLLVGG